MAVPRTFCAGTKLQRLHDRDGSAGPPLRCIKIPATLTLSAIFAKEYSPLPLALSAGGKIVQG